MGIGIDGFGKIGRLVWKMGWENPYLGLVQMNKIKGKVVKGISEGIGIKHGAIVTVHHVTNTQMIVEAPHRSCYCLQTLVLNATGFAAAISLIHPQLKGKLSGMAVRGPLSNAHLTDCVF
ncbi:MAG: hypothetical protein NZ901_08115 [Geminocystis sp.]|nr:hypothetical protein [Geminocystis sp.]MCS7148137.1 hypothetical protein [Geminocystis sp.]MDW8462028.1 hypothetical protein [Geminocystis sp.]